MDEFLCCSAAIPDAGVVFVKNDHAARFNPRVGRLDGGGDKVRIAHVRDEPAALVHLQQRFLAIFPVGNAHFAVEQASLDTDIWQRFGQRERAAPGFLAGLGASVAHVKLTLRRRAAFVNRCEREIAGHAAGRRAGIHPRQLEHDQRVHKILRAFEVTALRRLHERAGQAGFVIGFEQFILLGRPIVRIAFAFRDEPGDRPAGDAARGLHEHLQIKPVGEPPHDGAHVIAW